MKKLLFLVIALAGLMFTSCENVIFDDEGDCSVNYRIKFRYDMNMKFADAFNNSVSSVHLFAFDPSGILVYHKTEAGDILKDENYAMDVDLEPGNYTLLAWCGLQGGDSFSLTNQITVGSTTIEELQCEMKKEYDDNNNAYSDDDLNSLFHGIQEVDLPNEPGTHTRTVYLIKNTNTVRVVLQHLSGVDIYPEDFIYEITDDNTYMAHDNKIIPDEEVDYYPWIISSGSAGIYADIYGVKATQVNVAVAEFTINRLVVENNPVLTIYNAKDNSRVLAIPLKDYALLVKGNYNKKMDDQEYLDRQDEYNLTFFLDEHGLWSTSRIIINSWHIVLQNPDLQ